MLRIQKIGEKEKEADLPTISELSRMMKEIQADAMRSKYGDKLKNNLRIVVAPDGSSSFEYIGNDLAMQQEIRNHGLASALDLASLYLNKEGIPLSTDIKAVLISLGYKFDSKGRLIGVATTTPAPGTPAPAPEATAPAPGTPAPAPGTATPAAPAKTEQERILEKMSKADREAKEWADANIDSPKRTDKLMAEQILQNLKEKYPGIE